MASPPPPQAQMQATEFLLRILHAVSNAARSSPESSADRDTESRSSRPVKRSRGAEPEVPEIEQNALVTLCAATNPFVSETTVRDWLSCHPEDLSHLGAHKGRRVTPLHVAICSGNTDLVKLLLELGADRFAVDEGGKLPIHHALAADNVVALRLMLRYEDVRATVVGSNLRTYGPCTVLEYAFGTGQKHLGMNTMNELLRLPGVDVNCRNQKTGTTPLVMALVTGNVCAFTLLVNHPDIRFDEPPNKDNASPPLPFESPLITAMACEWPAAALEMIIRGASPDVKSSNGHSFRELLHKDDCNSPIMLQLRSLVAPPPPPVAPSA